jgi:hypothetical protein
MYTVRKITAEYLLPEEINCKIYSHLIDLQQELVRSIVRQHKKPYLIDIDNLETEYYPMHGQFPINKLIHFRDMYMRSSEYREWVRSLVPVEQMDTDPFIISKPPGIRKLVSESTWAWNYIKNQKKQTVDDIASRYNKIRSYRSRWKRSGWAEGQY